MKESLFICHASEDKDSVARPLAELLRRAAFDVWFDEYSLRLGDSLRRTIEMGLANCTHGVVLLSPSFFSKEWAQRELDALFSREVREKARLILPVWHLLDARLVSEKAPLLADRVAVSTADGLENVAEQIEAAIRGPAKTRWQTSTFVVSRLPRKDVDNRVNAAFEKLGFRCLRHQKPVQIVSLQDDRWEKRILYSIYACCTEAAFVACHIIEVGVQPEVFDA